MNFPKDMTWGELLGPAMKMTDPEEAKKYLSALIERGVKQFNHTPEESERIQKENLGYYAGYYDTKTMVRVHKLFNCAHPVFGKVKSQEDLPSPEEAFKMGQVAKVVKAKARAYKALEKRVEKLLT